MTTQEPILSHYKYMDKYLPDLFEKVGLNKEFASGYVVAHGDKAYGCKYEWEQAGIHFFHGVCLYMLTYTKLLGDYEPHESKQWVIDNYPKYKDLLPEVDPEDKDLWLWIGIDLGSEN